MHIRLAALSVAIVLTSAAAETSRFDVAASTNAIGLDLFRHLSAAQPKGNLVISPYSIESALALAYVGAAGATRTEMARVLRLPDDDARVAAGFAGLRMALDGVAASSRAIEWRVANRLFGQNGYAFREDFVARMRDGFGAPFAPLDFRSASEQARGTINTWVEEQTKSRIRELIPRGGVDGRTRLVLVNAIYLKAPWQQAFKAKLTRNEPFHLSGSPAAPVPTMRQQSHFGYATEDGLILVRLEYLGGGLHCLIILPPVGETLDAVAARLTPEQLARWSHLGAKSTTTYLDLHLPKFRASGASLRLGPTLGTLGLKTAFDRPPGSANFERIAPRKPDDYLVLSEVFHQTFVVLDEEGTEAAAATAVATAIGRSVDRKPKPIEVRVDRPFLFAIQHRATGTCLFLGRIADPR